MCTSPLLQQTVIEMNDSQRKKKQSKVPPLLIVYPRGVIFFLFTFVCIRFGSFIDLWRREIVLIQSPSVFTNSIKM